MSSRYPGKVGGGQQAALLELRFSDGRLLDPNEPAITGRLIPASQILNLDPRINRPGIVIHAGSAWENAWKDSESRRQQLDYRH
jgi:hypothetical protein